MKDVIRVDGLGKQFRRYHANRPWTFQEAVLSGLRGIKPIEQFWALRDVSFSIAPGQMLGILGRNGAGKSTLLQLMGGVGQPDEGRVKVNGRIGALLDLGSGFHTDLTGRENIFVMAVVAGLTRREVARRFDAIVQFAELEAFIDSPLRTYSTGMQMRLAFSVAVHTNPQLLLVDEFLSVGDLAFQAKCLERIMQLKNDGCAIALISHSPEQIQQLCDRALWLREGRVVALGEPSIVAGQYTSEMRSETKRRTPARAPKMTRSGIALAMEQNRFGSLEAEILDVRLMPDGALRYGDSLSIVIEYLASTPIEAPIFSVSISCEDGKLCLDTNTELMGAPLPRLEGKGKISLQLDRLDLSSGEYFIDVGLYAKDWKYAYDYHWHTYPFTVESPIPQTGVLCPPHRWQLNQVNSEIRSIHSR